MQKHSLESGVLYPANLSELLRVLAPVAEDTAGDGWGIFKSCQASILQAGARGNEVHCTLLIMTAELARRIRKSGSCVPMPEPGRVVRQPITLHQ